MRNTQNVAKRGIQHVHDTEDTKVSSFRKVLRTAKLAFFLGVVSFTVWVAMTIVPNTLAYWVIIKHPGDSIRVLHTLQQVDQNNGQQGLNQVLAAYNK